MYMFCHLKISHFPVKVWSNLYSMLQCTIKHITYPNICFLSHPFEHICFDNGQFIKFFTCILNGKKEDIYILKRIFSCSITNINYDAYTNKTYIIIVFGTPFHGNCFLKLNLLVPSQSWNDISLCGKTNYLLESFTFAFKFCIVLELIFVSLKPSWYFYVLFFKPTYKYGCLALWWTWSY